MKDLEKKLRVELTGVVIKEEDKTTINVRKYPLGLYSRVHEHVYLAVSESDLTLNNSETNIL
jgi:hypothetical protein